MLIGYTFRSKTCLSLRHLVIIGANQYDTPNQNDRRFRRSLSSLGDRGTVIGAGIDMTKPLLSFAGACGEVSTQYIGLHVSILHNDTAMSALMC